MNKFWCARCRRFHDKVPFGGYHVGVDLGSDEDFAVVVVAQAFPDGSGGTNFVVVNVGQLEVERIEGD